ALTAAGASPDAEIQDGVDLIPFLTGVRKDVPHDRLFWRAGDSHAVRLGDWKLVHDSSGRNQIFNLREDVGEQHDLAAAEPAKLAELEAAYANWECRTCSRRAATPHTGAALLIAALALAVGFTLAASMRLRRKREPVLTTVIRVAEPVSSR